MRARDYVWRQPSDADCGPSIQLTDKLARYWVKSVEQEQVRRGRGHNPKIHQGATPARAALPLNPASAEMQNLWATLAGPGARCLQSSRAQELAGNRQERRLGHEQLPCQAGPQPLKDSRKGPGGPGRCKLWRVRGHKNHKRPGPELVFLQQTPSH